MLNDPWKNLFRALHHAEEVWPRGSRTKELMPYNIRMPFPREQRWCSFPSRKLNVGYAAFEFLWYLRADPLDTSIAERARIWRDLMARGILQSNYGVYMFREGQFMRAREQLIQDRYSRQATIMILRPEHFKAKTPDIPCTLGISFYIRTQKSSMAGDFDKLHMHVNMRSSDAVFGLGNDIPCFTWTQELMMASLRNHFPTLGMGTYCHNSHSLHAYERHFDMVEKIGHGEEDREPVDEPKISGPEEALWVLKNPDDISYHKDRIPEEFKWAHWMHDQAYRSETDGNVDTR